MNRPLAIRRSIVLVARMIGLVVILVIDRARPSTTEASRQARTQARVQKWARDTAQLIGMRVRIDGEIPEGPVAIVSNHLSYIDIVALWCLVPGVFVARADVADWPLIGIAGRLIDTIFIERSRKRDLLRVIPEMQAALASGRNVIFFPEGTSTKGDQILPFKSSLFEAAAREAVPVVACSLQFETAPPAPSADWSICWWGDMEFTPHVFALLHLPGFEARVRFSEPLRVAPPRVTNSWPGVTKNASHDVEVYGKSAQLPMEKSGNEGTRRKSQRAHRLETPVPTRRMKDRKELCRLAYEAVVKKFDPTPPLVARLAPPLSPLMAVNETSCPAGPKSSALGTERPL